MQIQSLTLRTRDLAAQREFYADLFGFQIVAEDAEQLTLQAGSSRLTFLRDGDFGGSITLLSIFPAIRWKWPRTG